MSPKTHTLQSRLPGPPKEAVFGEKAFEEVIKVKTRPRQGARVHRDWCPVEKRRLGHRHAQRHDHVRRGGEAAVHTARREASRGARPARTRTSDFPPPDLVSKCFSVSAARSVTGCSSLSKPAPGLGEAIDPRNLQAWGLKNPREPEKAVAGRRMSMDKRSSPACRPWDSTLKMKFRRTEEV